MPFSRCSFTNDKPPDGIASIYWAWYTIDHERTARKVHYCLPCLTEQVLPILQASKATEPEDYLESCLDCHETLGDLGCMLYGKIFPPKSEPINFELWLCVKCFDTWRFSLSQVGAALPDRQQLTVAPASSPWARLSELQPAS